MTRPSWLRYLTYERLVIGVTRPLSIVRYLAKIVPNLLRLNLILNGLQRSIHNIVQEILSLPTVILKRWIISCLTLPFKLDFSEWRDQEWRHLSQ